MSASASPLVDPAEPFRVWGSPAYVDLKSLCFQPRAAPRQRGPCAAPPRAASPGSGGPGWDLGASQGFTTVVVRNLPEGYSREMLTRLLDTVGCSQGCYDFVYVPMDFASRTFRCFAFVNFVTSVDAAHFASIFQGFSKWEVPWDKEAVVDWSSLQGLDQQVERYRNSPVMHDSFPDEWKPLLLKDGIRQEFPPPTKALRYIRLRRRQSVDLRTGPELGVLSGVCPVIAYKAGKVATGDPDTATVAGHWADAASSDSDGASTSCAGSEPASRSDSSGSSLSQGFLPLVSPDTRVTQRCPP